MDQNGELGIPQNWELQKPSYAEIIRIFYFLEKWPFPSKDKFFNGNLISGKEITIKDGQEVVKGIKFRTKNGQEMKFKLDGRHLFSCDGKVLDIYGNQYMWGNEVLELSRYKYESLIRIGKLFSLRVPLLEVSVGTLSISFFSISILIGFYRFFIYKNKRLNS